MLLIVAGHYRHELEPAYWTRLVGWHTIITMPLLFMLSGFLFRFASPNEQINSYALFFKRKVPRLVYPYLVASLVLFAVKLVVGAFFTLQHPANLRALYYIAVDPLKGPATALWFIYALALMYFIYPALRMIARNDLVAFALSIGMMYLPATETFCLRPMLTHLPFFLFGILIAGRVDFDEMKARWALVLVLGGAIVFSTVLLGKNMGQPQSARFLAGMSGSLLIIGVSRFLTKPVGNVIGKAFELVGFYSMSIYLFHTVFLGVVRIMQHDVLAIHEYFWVGALVGIALAIVAPALIEKHILRKFALPRKYILGLKPAAAR